MLGARGGAADGSGRNSGRVTGLGKSEQTDRGDWLDERRRGGEGRRWAAGEGREWKVRGGKFVCFVGAVMVGLGWFEHWDF